MKYIEKIILENFQSHEYTELDLSRGVNVIVGPSDSGKTAIMRALRWNLFNEPSGVDFVREGEGEVSVTVRFQDQVEVVRRRTKSKNQYILRTPNAEELVFEGFGTHVPQEVIEATSIYKVMLDDKKALPLNFSDQLEGPFLLQESDAYKAQAIGRMVGVDILDETMRTTLRDKKQISSQKELLEEEIEETKNALDAFSELDKKIHHRDKLREILTTLKDWNLQLETARHYLAIKKNLLEEGQAASQLIAHYANLDILQDQLLQLQSKERRYQDYRQIFGSYLKNRDEQQKYLTLLKDLGDHQVIEAILENLLPSYNQYKTLKPLVERGKTISRKMAATVKMIKSTEPIHSVSMDDILSRYKTLEHYKDLKGAQIELKDRINRGKKFIALYTGVDEGEVIKGKIEKLFFRLQETTQLSTSKRRLVDEKNKGAMALEKAEKDCEEALRAYLIVLSKAGTCPLCHQPLDQDHLELIKKSLEE